MFMCQRMFAVNISRAANWGRGLGIPCPSVTPLPKKKYLNILTKIIIRRFQLSKFPSQLLQKLQETSPPWTPTATQWLRAWTVGVVKGGKQPCAPPEKFQATDCASCELADFFIVFQV